MQLTPINLIFMIGDYAVSVFLIILTLNHGGMIGGYTGPILAEQKKH